MTGIAQSNIYLVGALEDCLTALRQCDFGVSGYNAVSDSMWPNDGEKVVYSPAVLDHGMHEIMSVGLCRVQCPTTRGDIRGALVEPSRIPLLINLDSRFELLSCPGQSGGDEYTTPTDQYASSKCLGTEVIPVPFLNQCSRQRTPCKNGERYRGEYHPHPDPCFLEIFG